MIFPTLTALLLRDETFWITLALWFAGALVPEIVLIRITELNFVVNLVVLASLLLTVRILISVTVILYKNGRHGYEEALAEG